MRSASGSCVTLAELSIATRSKLVLTFAFAFFAFTAFAFGQYAVSIGIHAREEGFRGGIKFGSRNNPVAIGIPLSATGSAFTAFITALSFPGLAFGLELCFSCFTLCIINNAVTIGIKLFKALGLAFGLAFTPGSSDFFLG